MKTLADFKRDAASGKIKLEMVERYGKTGEEIPERYRGIRAIQSVNTVGIMLEIADGLTSSLDFPPAKLIEYDGKSLTIYERGERDLTEQERKILADWQKIEDDYYKQNPYGDAYWKKKDYFKKCPCPWLAGYETVKGKYYNGNKTNISLILRRKILCHGQIIVEVEKKEQNNASETKTVVL